MPGRVSGDRQQVGGDRPGRTGVPCRQNGISFGSSSRPNRVDTSAQRFFRRPQFVSSYPSVIYGRETHVTVLNPNQAKLLLLITGIFSAIVGVCLLPVDPVTGFALAALGGGLAAVSGAALVGNW